MRTLVSRRVLGSALGLVLASGLAFAGDRIGSIEIRGKPHNQPPASALFGGKHSATLRDYVEAIDAAATNDDVGTVLVRLKDAQLSMSQTEELGAAIKRVRAGGKKVSVFSEGYAATDLMLASYADNAVIQSGGAVSLPGMHMEEMFLADTLAWAGLKADMVQVGDYKGANEQMTRSAPSKAWDENINQLLDSLYANQRAALKSGRNMDDAKLDEAMKAAWMANGDDAVKTGLVDSQIDLPLLHDTVAKQAGLSETRITNLTKSDTEIDLESANPFTLLSQIMKPQQQTITGETIAILHIDGTIVDGDSKSGFSGDKSVGSRTVRNAIEDILDESLIKGVIVRVNSPGGSAIASEIMWQGLKRLAAKKPVWISVGDMAASGGYYVLAAGSRVYVNPSSIVGSIGVVGGKISMGGLYEKLKVHTVSRSRGPMASMFDSSSPWNDEELKTVKNKMTETFDLFKKRVAEGRHGIDLAKTAGGWLFAGQKAIDLKMADRLGGLHEAIADMKKELNLEDAEVADYPPAPSLGDVLEDMFGGQAAAPLNFAAPMATEAQLASAGRLLFGDATWQQLAQSANGLLQLRKEPVLLMHPGVLVIR
jgi:protease-4